MKVLNMENIVLEIKNLQSDFRTMRAPRKGLIYRGDKKIYTHFRDVILKMCIPFLGTLSIYIGNLRIRKEKKKTN